MLRTPQAERRTAGCCFIRPNPKDGETRYAEICANPLRLKLLRERRGDLSWFMKSPAEPIARMANLEDRCKGRFWHCVAIATPESVGAAVKHAAEAGDSKADVTESPPEQEPGPRLRLVVGACRGTWLDISVQNDFELVSWTAQLPTRADATDEANVNEIAVTERLAAIGCNPSEWQEQLDQPFGILDHHPAEEQMPQRRSLHIWRL